MSKKLLTKEQNNTLKTTTISREDRHTLLRSCNDTDAPYPIDETLAQLFEEQVDKTPNNIALVFAEQKLTYRQLNEKANQLAYAIRAHYQNNNSQGIQADTLIGLYLDRSLEMVISILGVLKAGGAYVPISPEDPQLRVQFMFEDTQTSLIITQAYYKPQLNKWTAKLDLVPNLLAIDDVSDDNPTANLAAINGPKDLAYVIYTSGTTGTPKGVMVQHSGVVNRIVWMQQKYPLSSSSRVLQKTPYIFDVSVWELLWGNLTGATIIIAAPEIHKEPDKLNELIIKSGVTTLHFVPSMFASFCDYLQQLQLSFPKNVQQVFCSGEALTVSHVDRFIKTNHDSTLLTNLYGPTEVSIDVTYFDIIESTNKFIPIGRPISNTQVYVLNEQQNIVQIGATGELYIGGAGLARGYLNQEELTGECFIDNPFATTDDKAKGYDRLYKTGDLVRWASNGNLEYLGRNDCQVKIRGYRIELGEIESALSSLKDVKQAVVIDLEKDGNKYLAAYLIKASGMGIDLDIEIDIEVCRDSLALKLPDYMLPATFTVLDSIPLTINGKLDRNSLPTPEFVNADKYVAPRNELEEQLCNIWQEVLSVKKVGIDDNFYQLGGNSITAIRLSAACRQQFKIDIPLALLFAKKTIKRLAPCINKLQMRIKANVGLTQYPLSFAQERLLFIENFEQGSNLYHIPYFVQLADDANLGALTASFNVVIHRHPVFNSVYRTDQHHLAYQVQLGGDIPIHMHVLTESQELLAVVKKEISRPFDLTTEPSLRLHCYEKNARQYLLILCHHIAFDGLSWKIFINELSQAYQALCQGAVVELPHLDISYGDYVLWQRRYLQGENLTKLLDFWQTQLSGYEQLQLPTDYPRPIKSDHEGGSIDIELDARLSEQLRKLAKAQKTTLYTVLLSGFYITLSAMSGQTDILLGTAVANRKQVQTRSLIGCFVNTLVMRSGVQATMTIEEFIRQVHGIVRQALAHQALPFERLVDALKVERDPSRHPIFQVMLSVKSFTQSHENNIHIPFKSISREDSKKLYTRAPFDLNLNLNTSQPTINGDFNYALSLFNEKTINRISGLYQRVLVAMVANQQLPIGEISLLSDFDRHTLLHTWNDTVATYPMDKTITQLFEEQVDKTPDNIALVFAEESLTYRQLNNKANQLAYAIRAHYQNNNSQDIKPDTLIGLYLDRSLEMVISILGVLKAGGAYVPISPEYPQLRAQYILGDTQTSLIITQPHYKQQLNKWSSKLDITPALLAIDDVSDDNPIVNLEPISTSKDLAYVIYTSGTTGTPKGVLQLHTNVVSLFESTDKYFQFTHKDTWVLFHEYTFDFSVWELWGALLYGGQLIVPTKSLTQDTCKFVQLCVNSQVTILNQTPAAFYLFIEESLSAAAKFPCLRNVIFGGDKLNLSRLKPWWNCYAQDAPLLVNMYGITETTVHVTYKSLSPKNNLKAANIGKPLNDLKAFVLNTQKNIVPIGATGELYIGGAGLARGYLNQEDLTGERFIENPFATPDDKAKGYNRLYKTGDLVRWAHDGNLEYLGRNDCQVKIRGYRIELGEIENALSALKDVKHAVVVDLEKDGHKYLAAYLIKASSMVSDIDIDIEACRDSLALKLPDYMLPATFTVLDSIPLTINGKLDRRALPTPYFENADKYIAPRNELEEQLCHIWQEVLSVKKVGIADNFFGIGGNSITAIRLTAACRQQFKIDIPLALLFEKKTIKALSGCLDKLQMLVIAHVELAQYPLSFAQERLLFIENFEQGSTAYHIPYFVQLADDVNLSALTAAFNVVIQRHPVLNSVYRSDEQNKSYQVQLGADISMHMHVLNESHELLVAAKKEISHPFDLTTEPSIRLHCYEKNARQYLLMLFHHIAFDGWSTTIFMDELAQAYRGLCQGASVVLPHLDISYGDYALWQSTYLQGENLTKLLDFWQQQLSGYEQLQLPADYPRPKQINYQGRNIDFQLDARLSEQLRTLAKANDTTLYTVLLSSFYISLSAMSGQTDVLLGTPSDNRDHAQTQSLIGFFVNTLVLRADVQAAMTIEEFISQVHGIVRQAKAHQELPFERLVDVLNVERDASRHPIFQVMFAIESFDTSYQSNNGLPFMASEFASSDDFYRPAKFDLSLLVDDSEAVIKGYFNYALSLFNEVTIKRISELYQLVLVAMVANQQLAIGEISLLSDFDRHTLLHTWNDTTASYPMDKTIAQLFEEQVDKKPDNIALVFAKESLTYRQLNQRANQLAYAIRAHYQNKNSQGIKPDTLIGLYLDRSLEMVISILGVLKAGGAYVPISPEYPKLRVRFMLEDTQTSLIITQPHYRQQLNDWIGELDITATLLAIDDVSENTSSVNLSAINGPKDLAYLIYTSGTTGTPKGVMIEQCSVSNLIFSQTSCMNFDESDAILWLADYIFDASVEQLFLSLLNGAVLHIPTRMDIVDVGIIRQKIVELGITHLHYTSKYLNALGALEEPHYLKKVISGGEAITKELVACWGRLLMNSYGPTESTVTVIQAIDYVQNSTINSIGRPINNTKVYVLNQQAMLVPIGAPGELYIGGVGLARGYLNQPELTGERFIENPFATPDDKAKGYNRLYKTGDLVRWAHDGNLEYLGRNDCQVKIRGYRIELGEIESSLSALKCVKQAVVVDLEKDGNKYLAAYLIKASGMGIDIDKCRDSLALKLPDYMLPATFTVLDSIPLTINGKLDRRALPAPDFESTDKYVAPRNELEEQLCHIWQEVLSVTKVGIADNFFGIGGNSITAIRLTAACRQQFKIDIPLALLFEKKTIEALSGCLDKLKMLVIAHVERDQYPLSFAQERLLFIENFEQGSNAYHIPYFVQLVDDVNLSALTAAFNVVIHRHPVLNSVYRRDEQNKAYQVQLGADISMHMHALDESHELLVAAKNEISRPFDLTTEPSIRLHCYEKNARQYLLMLFHHIAFDGWSTTIFMDELAQAYRGLCQGAVVVLPNLDISYGDYALWQRSYLQGENLTKLLDFWQTQLSGYEQLQLPTDYPRPKQINYQGRNIDFQLDARLSEQLRSLAKACETTLYTVLLSSFYISLSAMRGQTDVLLGTPSDNRDHAQTQSLIGFFVNTLVLRADVQAAMTIDEFITYVHGIVTQAKAHQQLPFERLVDVLNVERDASRHPIFQVMFAIDSFDTSNQSNNGLPFVASEFASSDDFYRPAKFDLSLFVDDSQPVIKGSFNYALSLFNEETIKRISEIYQRVLVAVVANQQLPIGEISLLSDFDRHTVLHTWNDTDAPYPMDKTLAQLFEEQVDKTPDNIALVFAEESLTYRQLNNKANQLAHAIRAHYQNNNSQGIKPDTLIGLYLDRSLDMVISIIGVLKAGGAYVPISPEYPQLRVQFMLDDTQTSLVITQPHYKQQLNNWTAKLDITPALLALDDVSENTSSVNLAAINGAKDLAYVIYTSGTTGKPKGVMIEHKNVVNYLYALTEHVGDLFNRVDFSANYCFDLSITTNLCPLLVGSCIYIFGKNISDIESYLQHIRANEIDFVKTTPSLASVIFANTEIKVKTLLLGGEILSKQCVAQLSNNVDVIYDEYGPTESTVGALIANVLPLMSKGIGKSYSNIKLYNLSPSLSLLPIGTPGELYIGGAGLARGYLNQEELTGERFIDNPFATTDDKAKGYDRLYKTGDLVRWAHDGNLEYLRRNDCQVKIRGYRIELGEIENALSALKDVKQAVVVDLENDGNKYLAAYLIKASGMVSEIEIDIEACRDSLSLKLPDYMVPATFTVLDSIPLTINGKLDRRALPTPEFVSADKYVAPRNELEEQLCNIWQEVLSVKRVGIDDNFFRIGGDSIVSIGLVSKMRREGFGLQVKDIFDAPTVAQLSRLLNAQATHLKIKTEQGVLTGSFDLLPIQDSFFAQKLANPQHFNQAFIIKIPGMIKYTEIEKALQVLTDQHDMLRCVFLEKASSKTKSYQQQYRDNIDGMSEPLYALNIADLNSVELHEKLTQLQSNFNYINGPTWQAVHLTGYLDGSARLFFAFHHLIIDVVSWRIIAQDIKQLLTKQLLSKQALTKQALTKQALTKQALTKQVLAPKGSSYRQWVRAVQHYALNNHCEREYWQGVCADQACLPALGTVAYHTVSLSVEQTDVLLHQANLGFHTQINDLLLSALAISLFEVLGSDVNHVTLEGHGREVIDETLDVSNTVGWFTSMYPVRLKAQQTISATIIHTKEMLSAIPNKGIGYGALHQQHAFAMKLPKISFNYLGQLGAQSDNEESSTWQISQEDAGQMIASDNTDHLLVNINGAVQAGILEFNIASRLSSILTDAFEAHFHSALVEVIEQAALKAKSGGVNTPSDYAVKGLSIDHLDFLERRLTTNKIAAIFPANSLQQGFISHHLHYPEDDAYRVQLLLDYNEALDLNCYQQAWSLASQRYPALRACFDWCDGLVQIITADSSINLDNFTIKDISHLSQDARAQEIIKIQQLDRKVPFDLSTPGLMRFTLIKQHANLVTVMQTTHHSISDGWSGPILLQQVHEYYNQLVLGMQVQIKVDRAFVDAQQYYSKAKSAATKHWKKAKERFQAANDLNFLFTTPVDLAELKTIAEPCASELIIKGDLYKQLKQMCQNQAITLNVAVQFTWHKLLHIYSGDEQTIVGTTVSGRDLPVDGIESSVGLYINTLPLTVDWDNSISVSAILNNIQKSIAEINSYSNVCLADLQANGQRLFHSLFVFENYPSPIDTNTSGIENHLTFRAAIEKTDYPLSVTAYEENESLVVKLHYSEEWLRQNQARRLLNQIQLILASIAKNTDHSHQQISLMDDLERHTLLHTWNDTVATYPMDKTIAQLFEEQVDKTPDNIALVFEEESLTYRQLNQRANQLAHAIRAHYQENFPQGIKADTLIGLYLDRSLEMVISILGVLKAGGAYVPISPEYPQLRVKFMFEDTQTSLIITQAHYKPQLNKWTAKLDLVPNLLAIDDVSDDTPTANLAAINGPKDLAYVIYTSGTTGTPKGVMVQHSGVVNRIVWMQQKYPLSSSSRVLQKTPYIFDVSVWELLWGNLTGATIIIAAPEIHKEPDKLNELIIKSGVTTLHFVPSMFASFCDYLQQLQLSFPKNVQQVFCSGEALTVSHVDRFIKTNHDSTLLTNLYGPTEVSIDVTYFDIIESTNKFIPIGRPISNTQVYVLNEQQNIVQIGATGELYIGGAGLARGYLNQEELTGECFIDNPFATPDDKAKGYDRLYKTGDLVRWASNGNLEYLGRNDCQVKIRGYRIELGEIESALSSLKDVKQAVVIDLENDGHKYLAAYLIKASGIPIDIEIDIEACRNSLALKLPDYMLPATFTVLDSIPLTINGKLDRGALPAPEFINADKYVAPRNKLEEQLCDIWQEVLGVKKVGIDDNFFRIGGDSIVSIGLVSKMRSEGFSLQVKDIFDAPTVAQVSRLLNAPATCLKIKTEPGVLTGSFDLLPIQAWFFAQKLAKPQHFNQAFIINIPREIKYAEIEKALQALTAQHDMLRSVFLKKASSKTKSYQQQYRDNIDGMCEPLYALNIAGLNSVELHEKLTQLQSNFSYIKGPTWQATHLTGHRDGSARLFFAFHHLIIDVVSWRIIAQDIKQLLTKPLLSKQALTKQALTKQALTKQALTKQVLAPKGSSYRQWVRAVQHYALNHQDERAYWQGVCADQAGLPALGAVAYHKVSLSVHQTDVLLHQANLGFHTQINDLLLSALAISLFDVLGSDVNHVTLEGHGREVIDETLDVSNTVGWFTSMYPVRLEAHNTISATIIHTKEMLSAVPHKGIGYGALHKQQAFAMSLPKIIFNYLGQLGAQSHDEESSNWQVSQEDAGQMIANDNTDHLLVNINGAVQAGILTFNIASRLSSILTKAFEAHFHRALVEVIEQAALKAKSGGVNTLSDLKEIYLTVNETANEAPIFFLPPGEGGAESYLNNVIPRLKNKKIILFNNFYHESYLKNDNAQNYYTYQTLAYQYIKYIKKIQSKGPYELFGWSFGGVLAFEIARQLENNGDTIAKIILVDSYFNYKKAIKAQCHEFSPLINKKLQKNINAKYQCNHGKYRTSAKIVLFKFLKVDKIKLEDIAKDTDEKLLYKAHEALACYYNKTIDNHINDYVDCSAIKIIQLTSTHRTWVDSSKDVDLVTKVIISTKNLYKNDK